MKIILWLTTLLLTGVCVAQNWVKPENPGDLDLPAQVQPTTAEQNQPQTASPLGDNKVILAELANSLDARKCAVGQEVEARSTMDLLAHGQIVLPRNTKILGHVTATKAASKDSRTSQVGIAFDRIVMKNGEEIPLQAEIQAIGLPLNAFTRHEPMAMGTLPGRPIFAMSGGSPVASQSGMDAPYAARPSAADLQINSFSSANSMGALGRGSRGVIGLKRLSLSPSLQNSVVSSPTDNVHLDSGTQLILRMP